MQSGEKMKTVLKVACMYCGADMGTKDGQGTEGTSHSICEACWHERFAEYGPYPGTATPDKEVPNAHKG